MHATIDKRCNDGKLASLISREQALVAAASAGPHMVRLAKCQRPESAKVGSRDESADTAPGHQMMCLARSTADFDTGGTRAPDTTFDQPGCVRSPGQRQNAPPGESTTPGGRVDHSSAHGRDAGTASRPPVVGFPSSRFPTIPTNTTIITTTTDRDGPTAGTRHDVRGAAADNASPAQWKRTGPATSGQARGAGDGQDTGLLLVLRFGPAAKELWPSPQGAHGHRHSPGRGETELTFVHSCCDLEASPIVAVSGSPPCFGAAALALPHSC